MPDGDWLDERVEAGRRRVHRELCRHCGARLLVGDDHDRCSMVARVDVEPVDAIGEVVALLSGRHSYDLVRGCELAFREIEHVRGVRRYPVLVTHHCERNSP